MATFFVVLLCSKLLLHNIIHATAITHWVVTEDGKIQAQFDSVFNMRRPYDLMSMIKQEKRSTSLNQLKKELIDRKEEIDKNEDKDTGLEKRFYESDPDCIIAGKPLPEYDLYISTVLPLENKGIRPEEFINLSAHPSTEPMTPDCTKVGVALDYSMHAFEHLQGVKDRRNLTGNPELGLKNAITHRDNVDDYGNLVYEALLKEKESWVLYNMAAFYWRIKGEPFHVIECVRRALHFSPRLQKDVALISLANVLHRAHYSNEAAVVVHAALDVSRELNVNHFTLGNIYAVLRDYNKSVICFENTLKIQPDFEAAAKRKHAVLCHSKLEVALEKQHKSLQRTLDDLRDYQKHHEYWQQQQEWLVAEQASPDTRGQQKAAYEDFMAESKENELGYGQYCKLEGEDVMCSWGKKRVFLTDDDFLPSYQYGFNPNDDPSNLDYMHPIRPPLYPEKHPVTPEILQKLPFKNSDWPSKEECDMNAQKFPAWNEFPTTYLSPENKGFEVKALLAEAQGLDKGEEHPLPWYPPVCATLTDIPEGPRSYDHIESVKDRTKIPLRLFDSTMRHTLLNHVEGLDMTEEEVGQRILTALKRKIGPSWVLYNLAGLYWRIYGNNYHGIECIRRALYFSPDEYKDVPLVNLANILYKWGRVDDAIKVMRDAVEVNDLEPDTHFFLGNLLASKVNMTGAMHHFEEALSQNALHTAALESLRIIKCYEKYHRSQQSSPKKEGESCNKQKLDKPQDSKVVCKNDNGKETCTIETKSSNCESCKQMCTVTPVTLRSCGNSGQDPAIDADNTGINAKHKVSLVHGKEGIVCANGKCEFVSNGVTSAQKNSQQCDGGDKAATNTHILNDEFHSQLLEISEHYQKNGVCTGEECQKLMLQFVTPIPTQERLLYLHSIPHYIDLAQTTTEIEHCLPEESMKTSSQSEAREHRPSTAIQHHKPHTKLEISKGVLHQRLIFVDSPEDLEVADTDCVIFNTGERSPGCALDEYKPFTEEVWLWEDSELSEEEVEEVLDPEDVLDYMRLHDFVMRRAAEAAESANNKNNDENTADDDNNEDTDDTLLDDARHQHTELQRTLKELIKTTNALKESILGKDGAELPQENNLDPQQQQCEKPQEVITEVVKKEEPFRRDKLDRRKFQYDPPIKGRMSDEEIIRFNPDPTRNIDNVKASTLPDWDWCKENYRRLDFSQFLSTWVSVTTKGIDVKEHVDYQFDTRGHFLPPFCNDQFAEADLPIDQLESLQELAALEYKAEVGLKESLQTLDGGEPRPIKEMGTRISLGLIKNQTSWVLLNLAGLFWRVEGNLRQAAICVRLAYEYSPIGVRDIAVLGLANILHQTGHLDDALLLTNIALEHAPDLVAIHFTMANLYAAKSDWARATQFYEATLGLQESFKPARDRLKNIQCNKVLSNPHKYKKSKAKENSKSEPSEDPKHRVINST